MLHIIRLLRAGFSLLPALLFLGTQVLCGYTFLSVLGFCEDLSMNTPLILNKL